MSYVKLKKLKLKNFRSWSNLEFSFDNLGVCLIHGVNGSGKSSIRYGVLYALFGRLKDIPVDRLVKDGCDEMFAKLEFTINNKKDVVIVRGRKRKKDGSFSSKCVIEIDGKKASYKKDKDIIESLLGYPRDVAEMLLSLSPDIITFVDAKDYNRKTFLEKIISTIELLRKEGKATIKDKEQTLEEKVSSILKKRERLEVEITFAKTTLASVKAEYSKTMERIRVLKSQIKEMRSSLNNNSFSEEEILAKEKKVEDISKKMASMREREYKLRAELEKKEEEYEKMRELFVCVSKVKKDIELQKKVLKDLKKSRDEEVCEWCGSKISNFNHIYSKIVAQKDKVKRLASKYGSMCEDLKKFDIDVEDKIKNIKKELEKIDDAIHKLVAEEYDIRAQLNSLEQNEKIILSIESMENELEKYASKANKKEVEERIYSLERDIENKQKQIERADKLLSKLNVRRNDVSGAFDVVYNILPNKVISKSLDVLTNISNSLICKVKEGSTIRFYMDGNSIIIEMNGKYFSQLSMGEKQIVRILTSFAWHVFLHTGFSNLKYNTLFIDEIMGSYLDEDSVSMVSKFLFAQVRSLFSNAIISTHNSNLVTKIPFDTDFLIQKKEGDSYIV